MFLRHIPSALLAVQMTGFAGDEVGATSEGNCGECYIVDRRTDLIGQMATYGAPPQPTKLLDLVVGHTENE
jgi:hypothetical protein